MSDKKYEKQEQQRRTLGLWMSLGMLFGAVVGVALWLTTEMFIWFPVFVGCGLSVGVAIAKGQEEKNKDNQ